ncbi:MAG TPA: DoxX family membrane protein [Anaeromyxobacteraceae bacterium]|nr:DoxX family membrane protein [Anaeromyxobacteraceae bacterium]
MQDKHVVSSYWALRVALGVVPIVAGLDKFTNLLADWEGYISPLARAVLPVSGTTFMHVAGIVEIVVGAGILLGRARVFGWVAMGWLVAIALNLVSSGRFLDVAARDVVMAVAAFALARLAVLVETVRVTAAQPARSSAAAHA